MSIREYKKEKKKKVLLKITNMETTDCEECGYPKKGYLHDDCESEDLRGCHSSQFRHRLQGENDSEQQFETERGN